MNGWRDDTQKLGYEKKLNTVKWQVKAANILEDSRNRIIMGTVETMDRYKPLMEEH